MNERARPRSPLRVTEFVYFLALEGHTETLIAEHVRTEEGGCRRCGRSWPCNWRQLGERALDVLRGYQ